MVWSFQKGRVGWRPSSGSRAWPGLAAAIPTMGHTWSTREHPFNERARVQQAFTCTDRWPHTWRPAACSVHPHASHTRSVALGSKALTGAAPPHATAPSEALPELLTGKGSPAYSLQHSGGPSGQTREEGHRDLQGN